MKDPDTYSVRNLAELHGLSLKRVDAILRLKGLEQSWIKVSFLCRTPVARCAQLSMMSPNRLVLKTSNTWL